MSLVNTDNTNYKEEIFGDDELKVVIFSATWCGPCRMYHPIVAEYVAQHPDMKFCGNDVDISTQAALEFNIEAVPTTIIVKNKKEVSRVLGGQSLEELSAMIAAHKQ